MAAEPHAPPGRTRPESPQHDAGARPAAHVRHAALIVNTRSRRGRVLFRDAIDQLEAKGIALDASHSVGDPRRLAAVVEREVARGAGTIIVGGGDGTIGAIAGVLANRDIVLGLLPLGTGNNFATRTLGIPASLDGAVDVIAAGHSVAVDLGEVNGHYFVNTASIGLSSEVARETPPGLKRHLGVLAYALTGLRLLVARRRFRCTVVLAGRRESFRTHQLVVANGSHFGVAKVAPEVLLESGQLLVFSIATSTRWRTLRA